MAIKKEKKTETKKGVKKTPALKKEEKKKVIKVKPASADKPAKKIQVKVKKHAAEREIPVSAEQALELPPQPPYITPQAVPVSRIEEPVELPRSYGETKISLLVRDPFWVYTYWEIQNSTIDGMKAELKEKFDSSKKILRVNDVTDINFNGKNAHSYFDIEFAGDANSWYVRVPAAARSYCIEIGYLLPDGYFKVIARSNVVATPRESLSSVIDEEWMSVDFERMYALSGGFATGMSSVDFKRQLAERLAKEISSGAVSSLSSFARVPEKQKRFWLVVDTELIVYGATEPDAHVTIQGKPIKLRGDGSFSVRFALPDGRQFIDVKAVSADKSDKRTITPIVSRKTGT